MKTPQEKEFQRRIDVYNERIESVKKFLLDAIENNQTMKFVVCRIKTYQPVKLTSTGAHLLTSYPQARTFDNAEEASDFAIFCRSRDMSNIYVVLRLSVAVNFHIDAMQNSKREALLLRARKVIAAQPKPWWKE